MIPINLSGSPMRMIVTLLVLAAVLLAASACGGVLTFEVATPPPPVAPAVSPIIPPTAPAAQAALQPTLLPTATVAVTETPVVFNRVKIFLIAVEDAGKAGPAVGCGDSIVAVDRTIEQTTAPLGAALEELLSLHDRDYGQSGLYNALYQSDLQVESISLSDRQATVRLTGKLQLGGECDDPRVEAQLTQTALQFSTVKSVEFLVNGKPLKTLLGGK